MLRKGVGSEKAKANLKRAKDKAPDRGRGAKLTAKNINTNYVGVRTAALPDTVKLEANADLSVQEQLKNVLTQHSVKLIDLFREWDDDGNGALDKKEMRQAVAALGYDAPRAEVDALFDSIDTDLSGWIEYEECAFAAITPFRLFRTDGRCLPLVQIQESSQRFRSTACCCGCREAKAKAPSNSSPSAKPRECISSAAASYASMDAAAVEPAQAELLPRQAQHQSLGTLSRVGRG